MKLFSIRLRQAGWGARFCLFVLMIGTASAARATPSKPRYSRRVCFKLNQQLIFPDFTLRYTGQTHVNSPVFPPGFTYENFVVKNRSHEQRVSWTGGAGIIGPAAFEVGRKSFRLELHHSEQRGVLEAGELVISLVSPG